MILPKPLGNVLPLSKVQEREQRLREAGISKKEIARLTRKAVAKLDEALDATKKTYASFEGRITDERDDPDHALRSKAAAEVLSLVDAYPSKQEGLVPSKVQVEVKFPDWFKPKQAIDVKVQPVQE